jgi:hypothetical protein
VTDDQPLSEETWRQLRREARSTADEARREEAERLTGEAMATADLAALSRLEERLEALGQAWAVHEKPLSSRIPLIGPWLGRLGLRLGRFLLQHQVAFNAEAVRTLQEGYRAQRLLADAAVARGDALFSRLDERLLALEARLRDLEAEVERLRRG